MRCKTLQSLGPGVANNLFSFRKSCFVYGLTEVLHCGSGHVRCWKFQELGKFVFTDHFARDVLSASIGRVPRWTMAIGVGGVVTQAQLELPILCYFNRSMAAIQLGKANVPD